MRKIFTILFAALMSVGMFATTVTWDNSTLSSIYLHGGDSFTQDGVTLTVLDGMIDGRNFMGFSNDASFKFSTSLGNFTKIEITGNINALGGSGWTQTILGAVWTGEANETTFGMFFENVSQIVFTIGEPTVAVTGVTLNQSEAQMTVGGETLTLTATVNPNNATDQSVSWSTSDANVATVENGVVTAVAAGNATITVTTTDGSFTATCAVTVSNPAPAATVVTITDSDFPAWGESFTKDGVTVSAGSIDGMYGNISGPGSFSTTLGNFTKIEVSAASISVSGEGWSGDSEHKTWTGNASSVSFIGDINGYEEGTTLKFTIEESAPAEVTVVFAANDKTVERTVTLPHTFKCDWAGGMERPDELDIIIHELYNDYYYCNSNMNASGSDQVEAGTEEDPKNDYITIKGVFEGTATVTGDYLDYIAGDYGEHNYSITISIKGDEPEPLFEMSYEDKWLNIVPADAETPYILWLDSKLFYDGKYTEYTQEKMGGYMDYNVGLINEYNMIDLFLFSGEQKIAPNALLASQGTSPYSLDEECIAFIFKYDTTDKKRSSDVEYFVFTYAGEPEQPTGIENIVLTEKAKKVIVDGMVYIVRDGKLFNMTGAQVK